MPVINAWALIKFQSSKRGFKFAISGACKNASLSNGLNKPHVLKLFSKILDISDPIFFFFRDFSNDCLEFLSIDNGDTATGSGFRLPLVISTSINSKALKGIIKNTSLSLSEEDALKAQIFGCWSIPLGLPYNENLLVRIKLQLNPDGTVTQSEILDHARMNKPGQGFYKVLAESALRAIKLCQPLRVPTTGYERWKELQLNFDAREMLEG